MAKCVKYKKDINTASRMGFWNTPNGDVMCHECFNEMWDEEMGKEGAHG